MTSESGVGKQTQSGYGGTIRAGGVSHRCVYCLSQAGTGTDGAFWGGHEGVMRGCVDVQGTGPSSPGAGTPGSGPRRAEDLRMGHDVLDPAMLPERLGRWADGTLPGAGGGRRQQMLGVH